MKYAQISIRLNQLGQEMASRLPEAVKALAGAITYNVDNVEPVIPVDKGPLRASEKVEYPAPNMARISYGGGDAPYAGVVHEGFPHLEGPINWTRPGSGPFFFQLKLSNKSLHKGYAKVVMTELKKALKRA
jgi:hypothetical protein